MKKCAFTLIELLVVITIIAILVSLVMPAVASVRKSAKQTQALSNMRQLGTAFINYSGDHNGQLPGDKVTGANDSRGDVQSAAATEVWYNALPRQMGKKTAADYATGAHADFYTNDNLAFCPAATYPANVANQSTPYFAIAMNSKLNGAPLPTIQEPMKTVIFLEGGLPNETKSYSGQSAYNGQPAVYASRFIARYNGNGLLVFADGHAEAMPWKNVIGTTGKNNGKAITPQPGATGYNEATSLARVVWTADPNDPAGSLP